MISLAHWLTLAAFLTFFGLLNLFAPKQQIPPKIEWRKSPIPKVTGKSRG